MVRGKSSNPQAIDIEVRQDGDPDALLGLPNACPACAWIDTPPQGGGLKRRVRAGDPLLDQPPPGVPGG
jgi:hypothetical protein